MDKPQEMKLKLQPDDLETIGCPNPKCDSVVWEAAMILKKISKFQSATDDDQILNIPIVVCKKCGTVLEDALNFKL